MKRTLTLVADLGLNQSVTVTVANDGKLTDAGRRLVHDFVDRFFDRMLPDATLRGVEK